MTKNGMEKIVVRVTGVDGNLKTAGFPESAAVIDEVVVSAGKGP